MNAADVALVAKGADGDDDDDDDDDNDDDNNNHDDDDGKKKSSSKKKKAKVDGAAGAKPDEDANAAHARMLAGQCRNTALSHNAQQRSSVMLVFNIYIFINLLILQLQLPKRAR